MLKGRRKRDGGEERGATEDQMEDLRRETEKELICSKLMVIALTYSPLQLRLSLVSDQSFSSAAPPPSPPCLLWPLLRERALQPVPGLFFLLLCAPKSLTPPFWCFTFFPWTLTFPGGLDTSPDHSASLLQETIFLLLPPSSSHPYMNAHSPFKIIFCDFCYPQFIFWNFNMSI